VCFRIKRSVNKDPTAQIILKVVIYLYAYDY
jgi:hypothetical protein